MSYLNVGEMNAPVENTGEAHLPCVVLVDTSGSMEPAMAELHRGLEELGAAIRDDEKAAGSVEICIISFNSTVTVEAPFCPAYDYAVPNLSCTGSTHMQEAVDLALKQLEVRKQEYVASGTTHYQPWIFMLTDGYPYPHGMDNSPFDRLLETQRMGKCTFFGVGIGSGVNYDLLKSLNKDGVALQASKTDFAGAFVWLSKSLSSVSHSKPGDSIALPSPAEHQLTIVS